MGPLPDVPRSSAALALGLLFLALLFRPVLAAPAVSGPPAATPAPAGIASPRLPRFNDAVDVVVLRIALKGNDQDNPPQAPIRNRWVQLAANGQSGIAVIYPDIGEPYRSVFSSIIDGIEEKAKVSVPAFAIGANANTQNLAAELKRLNIQIVIALGRNGLRATAGLDHDLSVVVGGVVSMQESEMQGLAVRSMAPDPALLLDRLRSLLPSIRRVFVVYDPRQNSWLIRLAREAAKNLNIELVAQEAQDLKTAMRFYQEDVGVADPRRDAIWLPQDSVTVEESATLPFVLQEAWARSLPVFSSSVGHVKRGALFSLYPDNAELGRNLAKYALTHLSAGSQPARTVVPLREVLMAVNLRTAAHVGVNLGNRQQLGFDMVYPEQ
jgi:putative tryptophan/tyrosine transport system substrate-binding protein